MKTQNAAEAEVEAYKRKMLADRLAQCTPTQQAFFGRVYPRGVREEQLMNAIDLCDRTIRKNKADPTRVGAGLFLPAPERTP
jgi:hypothetical protein